MGKMEETGCDLFIDVHGDEELTYNFIAGIEGIPSWDDRLHKLQVSKIFCNKQRKIFYLVNPEDVLVKLRKSSKK